MANQFGRLKNHRETLKKKCPPEEFQRLKRTFLNNIKKDDRDKEFRFIGENLHRQRVERIVFLIFETQDSLPFLWVDSQLPFCWNHPWEWEKYDYIRYEWGHLEPKESLSHTVPILENLCLMSARCNNHIQSSLPLKDLLILFDGSSRSYSAHGRDSLAGVA